MPAKSGADEATDRLGPDPGTRRSRHPSFEEMRKEKLSEESLQHAFFGSKHNCVNLFKGKPCHVNLWGDAQTGIEALRHQRTYVLST